MSKTKTFKQIWEESPISRRSEIKAAMVSRLRIADATFWRWTKGFSPSGYAVQVAAADVLAEILGYSYKAEDLFPIK